MDEAKLLALANRVVILNLKDSSDMITEDINKADLIQKMHPDFIMQL